MPITHERGYLIPAIGLEYVRCANQLAHSKIEKNKVLEIKDEVLHNIRDSGEF